MIDTHCHPLPFIDDGAENWETALAMARMASDDGVRQWIATPHWKGGEGETRQVLQRLEELRKRLEAERIPLRIHTGNEVILVPRLVESLQEGTALTLAESKYVLLETAQLEYGAFIQQALFQLQSSGYRVILAHPERMSKWHTDLGEIVDLMRRDCYLQVNQGSLTGGFGSAVKKQAERLVSLGWVSLLASDAHSAGSRPPLLSAARKRCEELIGADAARRLVEDNPARVLCNELLPYVDVDRRPPPRPRWFSWPWSRG